MKNKQIESIEDIPFISDIYSKNGCLITCSNCEQKLFFTIIDYNCEDKTGNYHLGYDCPVCGETYIYTEKMNLKDCLNAIKLLCKHFNDGGMPGTGIRMELHTVRTE